MTATSTAWVPHGNPRGHAGPSGTELFCQRPDISKSLAEEPLAQGARVDDLKAWRIAEVTSVPLTAPPAASPQPAPRLPPASEQSKLRRWQVLQNLWFSDNSTFVGSVGQIWTPVMRFWLLLQEPPIVGVGRQTSNILHCLSLSHS